MQELHAMFSLRHVPGNISSVSAWLSVSKVSGMVDLLKKEGRFSWMQACLLPILVSFGLCSSAPAKEASQNSPTATNANLSTKRHLSVMMSKEGYVSYTGVTASHFARNLEDVLQVSVPL